MTPTAANRGSELSIGARERLGLAEMGRGLSHMWRIAIIRALLEATSEHSTTDLANRLDTSVNRIDHHVKYLLTLGMIESKRSRQVRGTRQHFYLLVPAVRELLAAIVRHPLPAHADVDAIAEHTLPFSAPPRAD
jgi:predicted ArsR family transcriptional regulator